MRIMIAEDQTMVRRHEPDVAVLDIAAGLHLSDGAVRNHLSAAIQKLGASNRAEAVQIAQQKGWL